MTIDRSLTESFSRGEVALFVGSAFGPPELRDIAPYGLIDHLLEGSQGGDPQKNLYFKEPSIRDTRSRSLALKRLKSRLDEWQQAPDTTLEPLLSLPVRHIITTLLDDSLVHAATRAGRSCLMNALGMWSKREPDCEVIPIRGWIGDPETLELEASDVRRLHTVRTRREARVQDIIDQHIVVALGYTPSDILFRDLFLQAKRSRGLRSRVIYLVGLDPQQGQDWRRVGQARPLDVSVSEFVNVVYNSAHRMGEEEPHAFHVVPQNHLVSQAHTVPDAHLVPEAHRHAPPPMTIPIRSNQAIPPRSLEEQGPEEVGTQPGAVDLSLVPECDEAVQFAADALEREDHRSGFEGEGEAPYFEDTLSAETPPWTTAKKAPVDEGALLDLPGDEGALLGLHDEGALLDLPGDEEAQSELRGSGEPWPVFQRAAQSAFRGIEDILADLRGDEEAEAKAEAEAEEAATGPALSATSLRELEDLRLYLLYGQQGLAVVEYQDGPDGRFVYDTYVRPNLGPIEVDLIDLGNLEPGTRLDEIVQSRTSSNPLAIVGLEQLAGDYLGQQKSVLSEFNQLRETLVQGMVILLIPNSVGSLFYRYARDLLDWSSLRISLEISQEGSQTATPATPSGVTKDVFRGDTPVSPEMPALGRYHDFAPAAACTPDTGAIAPRGQGPSSLLKRLRWSLTRKKKDVSAPEDTSAPNATAQPATAFKAAAHLTEPIHERQPLPKTAEPASGLGKGGLEVSQCASDEARRALRHILAQRVVRTKEIKQIASDAGLTAGRIAFEGAPERIWQAVIDEAAREDSATFDRLVQELLDRYPSDGALHAWVDRYARESK